MNLVKKRIEIFDILIKLLVTLFDNNFIMKFKYCIKIIKHMSYIHFEEKNDNNIKWM